MSEGKLYIFDRSQFAIDGGTGEELEVVASRRTTSDIDNLINPPIIGGKIEPLCPPIGSVAEYMQWIRENQDALRLATLGIEADLVDDEAK